MKDDFLKIFKDDDFLSKENNIKGGFKESAAKELTVLPKYFSLLFMVTMVTPVAYLLIANLNIFELILFIFK